MPESKDHKPQVITEELHLASAVGFFDWNLDSFQERLHEIIQVLLLKGCKRESISIELHARDGDAGSSFDNGYSHAHADLTVKCIRSETPEEAKARVKRVLAAERYSESARKRLEDLRTKQKDDKDRRTYERLKARFEP